MNEQTLYSGAVALLKQLIQTSSFSKEEEETAKHIRQHLLLSGIVSEQLGNNIIAKNKFFKNNEKNIRRL